MTLSLLRRSISQIISIQGGSFLMSDESNSLGIEVCDNLHLFVLECLMKDFSREEARRQAAEQLKLGHQELSQMEGIADKLKGSLALQALLARQTPKRSAVVFCIRFLSQRFCRRCSAWLSYSKWVLRINDPHHNSSCHEVSTDAR
jgi:hypothetical protein